MLEVRFETALEILESNEEPFRKAIKLEKAKVKPCKILIKYWEGQIKFLVIMARKLKKTDTYAIDLLWQQHVLRDDRKSIFYPIVNDVVRFSRRQEKSTARSPSGAA
jgi:hypothetical protein